MQGLIEFVFGNLFFVLIVLWGLFSLFNRSQNTDEKRRRTTQERPTKRPQEVDWKQIFQQEERAQQKKQSVHADVKREIREGATHLNERLGEQFEALQRKKEEAQKAMDNVSKSPIRQANKSTHTKSRNVHLNFHEITKKQVIEGVVWSEILGKPRSQHPHQHRFRYRQR